MNSRQFSPDESIPQIFIHDENIRRKYPAVAGLDEAGRGPLAGPVVAAAVILPGDTVIKFLKNSGRVCSGKL
jgi:ribonuclease HII